MGTARFIPSAPDGQQSHERRPFARQIRVAIATKSWRHAFVNFVLQLQHGFGGQKAGARAIVARPARLG
jgi:hypothetical protein